MADMPTDKSELFRSLPILITLMDREGRFLDVSNEWERRTGYTRAELRGRRPDELATPASARRIREEHLPRFRRTGRLDHVPVEFFAKDGQPLEFLATTIASYAPEDGSLLYSVSLFEELSDRERLERRFVDLYESTPAMLHTVDADGRITAVSNH